ncbi:hypothetical protein HMI55_001995 [Coelomomyces lativittatus]|nr:hypothetical protein HMI55_001995 [Coelomomyces lativittatus]
MTPTTFAAIADSKLADNLFYFLLSKLNATKAQKLFRMPLPPEDFSSKREFRTLVYQWLEEIKPYFIGSAVLRKSLLDEGRGERFQELLFAVTTYTLQVVLKRTFPEANAPDFIDLHSKSTQSLDDRLKACQEKYKLCLQDHAAKQHTWKTYSQYLIHENNTLDTLLNEMHHQRHQHQQRRRSSSSFFQSQQQWLETSIQFSHAWHTFAQHPWEHAQAQLQTALTHPSTLVLKGNDPTHPMDWTRLVHLADLSIQPLTENTLDSFQMYLDNLLQQQTLKLNQVEKSLHTLTYQLDRFPELKVNVSPTTSSSTTEPPLTLGFPTIDIHPSSRPTSPSFTFTSIPGSLEPYGRHRRFQPTSPSPSPSKPRPRPSTPLRTASMKKPPSSSLRTTTDPRRSSAVLGTPTPSPLSTLRHPNSITTPLSTRRVSRTPGSSSSKSAWVGSSPSTPMHLRFSDDLSAWEISDTEFIHDVRFQSYTSPRSSS